MTISTYPRPLSLQSQFISKPATSNPRLWVLAHEPNPIQALGSFQLLGRSTVLPLASEVPSLSTNGGFTP